MSARSAHPPFEGLPDLPAIRELQDRRQWVAWRYETRPGPNGPKETKPPVNPHTGFGASHSDPRTWGTYAEAADRARRVGLPGVGYVMSADDEYTGADLDKCRDPETGQLDQWAADVVAFAETYTEISPSGRGLRMLWRGKVEKTSKADPVHVEIYRDRRFLTITGNHLPGTPTTIQPAPRTCEALQARVDAWTAERDAARGDVPTVPVPGAAGELRTLQPSGRNGAFFRNVNTAALTALASWVPALFGPAATHQPGTGAWRVSSRSLGRDLEEDLSIAPNGIVDWGVHDIGDPRGGKRTAVDLVLEFGGYRTATEAAGWLCDRLGRQPEDFGWQDPGGGGDVAHGAALAAALTAPKLIRHADGVVTDEDGVVVDDPEPPSTIEPVTADLEIGGLGSAIAEFIHTTAVRKSEQFAFLPAMSLLSVMFGRRFVSPTGMPLNLNLVGIADSGFGKDHPMQMVSSLLHSAGLDFLLAPSEFSSDSAIEIVLRSKPCCISTVGEYGVMMQGVSSKNSGGHERKIRKSILDLYTAGTAPWSGKATADRTKPTSPIWYPTFSLMGFSTPTEFYDGLEERNLKDGFLARHIFLTLTKRPGFSKPPSKVPPPELLQLLKQAMAWAPEGNLASVRVAERPCTLTTVPWADGAAEEAFMAIVDWVDEMSDANPDLSGVINRAAENCLRMATLRALSRMVARHTVKPDLRKATVSASDVEWASAIVRQSLHVIETGLKTYLAGSDFERAHKTALSAIRAAGPEGIAESRLRVVKGLSKLEQRLWSQVIDYLSMAELIRVEMNRTGRPGKRYFARVVDA